MTTLTQCEGCEAPLCYYEREWKRGEINVEWKLCGQHEWESECLPHVLNAPVEHEEW